MTTTQRPRHPLTTTLALLIAANQRKATELEYEIHAVIAGLVDIEEWTDEKKADLYARLAESINKEDRIIDLERKVSFALWQNDQFPFV
jgi:hypothetical protein